MDYPKWGVSYSVRPSSALGWRQVQRTCTDLILRIAASAQQMDYPKWGVSYSVRPSSALGWRQVQRTCTYIILWIAELSLLFFSIYSTIHFRSDITLIYSFIPNDGKFEFASAKRISRWCRCVAPAAVQRRTLGPPGKARISSGGSRSFGARP